MKKKLPEGLLSLLVVSLLGARVDAQSRGAAPEDELFRTIASLDRAVFDAYNRCDLEKLGAFFAEDLEFYHDKTGLSRSRQSLVDAVKRNICGKVRRELVPGTLEVYPMQGYGAVQMGAHRFCDSKATQCDETAGVAKFVHLWENKGGTWLITRVISYDHGPPRR